MKIMSTIESTTETSLKSKSKEDGSNILTSRVPNEILWKAGDRFHGLFDEYIEHLGTKHASQRIAVELCDRQVSFSALSALANRISHYLIAQGVSPGDRVAILFERTPEAYASVLALSQVGAVFVPLDPSFPADRVAFIIEDSAIETVLSLTIYSTVFNPLDVNFIALDACEDDIAKLPATKPNVELTGEDSPAYIIYTSGTTGRPKGVQIDHSSICNFMRVAKGCYGFSESDRVYQSLTLAFDYSFEEIWVPLICGACLVPAPSGVNLVGDELHQFLQDNRITAYCSVPTILATIDADLPDLKLLLVSGEACPVDIAQRWATAERRLLNVYGPTETTVSATWSVVEPNKPITIGEPLTTYSVVIMEPETTRVLPYGEVGEIVIAGVGVASGYLNREAETEKAFIKDTVGMPQNPGGMLYRSGDLGCITESGHIEYRGRADTQVKIRGFRIELAEIEQVARDVSGINSFVVNPWSGENGTELVAYFVPDTQSSEPKTVDVSKIHNDMAERLPPYMVPCQFEELEALPLQASGKIDRRALPEPSATRLTDSGREFIQPAEGLESDLADILMSTLKIESVSADADFFNDLGADSLIMARYLGAVRRKLKQKKASMVLVYENPSIIALAAALDATAEAKPSTTAKQSSSEKADTKNPDGAGETNNPSDGSNNDLRYAPLPQRENWVASRAQHRLCAIMQLAYMFIVAVVFTTMAAVAIRWVFASQGWADIYLRSVGSSVFMFISLIVFSIAVKWIAVGRFTEKEIPLWSAAYLRFWIAKTAIRTSPMIAFVGTPFYNYYLRLLGARIGKGTLIFAPAPVCTDLISIGDNTLVRQDSIFNGYTVHRGWVRTGSVHIGDQAYIGEQTVLDINTVIGNSTQLGNSSCLQEGQQVPDGEIWHGTPARKTTVNYDRVEGLNISRWAGEIYTGSFMLSGFLVTGPIVFMIAYLILTNVFGTTSESIGSASSISLAMIPLVMLGLYIGSIVVAMLNVVTIPKLYNLFFKPDKVHKLFGFQYWLARSINQSSNSLFLHSLWGDSSLIMPYFKAVGYDLSTATQNGSNFGVEQIHHSPFLCKFNRNTLVSDGLYMLNMDMSTSSFRMSQIEVPADAYLGNDLRYPVGAKVGADCMIATKAMLPIEGKLHEGVGILGSPPIEIPRSVARDGRFDHYKKPGIFEQRLKMKLKSNLITLGLFMLRAYIAMVVIGLVVAGVVKLLFTDSIPSSVNIGLIGGVLAMFSLFFVSLYNIAWEWAVVKLYPVKPRVCSLYERPFWNHERFWKMNINLILETFNGTPIKPLMLKLQGAKIGKMVFDNGAGITEPSTVEIGDYACMNFGSAVQGHSLEDGTFKSDSIKLGKRCTIGVSGFVHYGTNIGDDAVIEAHSFLMKGSVVGNSERWGGNPAQPIVEAVEPVALETLKATVGLETKIRSVALAEVD